MKKAILVALMGVFTLGVNAGDWGKAPVYDKTPIEECVDLGGSISAGYMSDYIFYGVRFAEDSVWTDVNYTFDLPIPVNVGVWYLNGIVPSDYDELDLYASIDVGTYGGFDVSLGYVHYFYPESAGVNSYGEIGIDVSRSLGFVDLIAEANWAITAGWYYQAGLEKTIPINDMVSLVLGAGVGYSDSYFDGLVPNAFTPRNSGWNHYYISAALPIELNCRTTLTPYISYTGSPDTWIVDGIDGQGTGDFQNDIFSAGVSISVSF